MRRRPCSCRVPAPRFGSSRGASAPIAGPLIVFIDLGYRSVAGLKWFGDVKRGPAILWLPAWPWGVVWFGLGAFYHFG